MPNDGVQRPDHLVFRYNESGNISSLDPAFARNLKTFGPPINYLTVWSNLMTLKHQARYRL